MKRTTCSARPRQAEELMEAPDGWVWIWLVVAVVFAVGEMSSPGSFFMLPFAFGALAASGLAFVDAGSVIQWAAFLGVAVGTFVGFRPLARRLDRGGEDEGIGSRRLIGQTAVITKAIPAGGDLGLARIHREDWRAESLDGTAISEGARVRVTEVEGTRVLVALIDDSPSTEPPTPPDTSPPTSPEQGADL